MALLTFGLTVVRHGETQYNKDGLLQGQAIDSPLSETGLRQAEAVGRYLKDVTFTNVFVSDMLRARQTAETIMKCNISCSGQEMVCDSLLKEKSFGIAEGLKVKDFKDMAQAAGLSWLDFVPPGGETNQQVRQRVTEFLERMLRRIEADHWREGGRGEAETSPTEGRADDGVRGVPVHALVVGHGAFIRVALRYFVEELQCAPPPGSDRAHMLSLCPNTGVCRFILTARKEGDGRLAAYGVDCVFVHRAEHVEA